MESKYLGKVFEGYEVVNSYLKNDYNKAYANGKVEPHRAYNYTLVNYDEHKSLTISGNQLRKINNGSRSIAEMLTSDARACRNPQIQRLKRA